MFFDKEFENLSQACIYVRHTIQKIAHELFANLFFKDNIRLQYPVSNACQKIFKVTFGTVFEKFN